ncbi:hypothetical protein [Sciscionella sediminilitoris]|uniref:hypothetical protein n=1 Tax=Sciscionella sediminilitoris TaxID=1445613 RepID=UPI0012E10CC5|nr:hypothetical protein [Sciscionella sp. SE31]
MSEPPRARASISVPIIAVLAVLVTLAALFGAWQLRLPTQQDTASADSPGSGRNDKCVRTDCPVLTSVESVDGAVRLHATADGEQGALEVPGAESALRITVTDVGARLAKDSLSCVPGDGTVGATCLVAGDSPQGRVGEVFVYKQASWDRVDRPYVASSGILQLRATDGRNAVIAVQRGCRSEDCQSSRVYAQVFAVGGRDLGCTETYASKYSLPSWPEVAPRGYQLHPCTDN